MGAEIDVVAALELVCRLHAAGLLRALEDLDTYVRRDGLALPPDLARLRRAALTARNRMAPQVLADYAAAADGDDVTAPLRLFTYREVADRLGVGLRTVEQMVADGELRTVRLGRSARVTPSALADLIAALEAA